MTSKSRSAYPRQQLLAAAVMACFAAGAQALPTAPTVANGTASFNQVGNVLTVTNSNGAIINWQTFSIGAGETTRFIQPAASSAVLNRILANDPSTIYGTLSSNGKVWLINPAGILVGAGGVIDTAGFVASTLNVSAADFLAGRLRFQATSNAGDVANRGTITTPTGGSVYLIGTNVSNEGLINTPSGETLLAAGATVELIDTSTPGVKVEITGTANNATNLGTVVAEAGRIGIAGMIVRNSGTLDASSVVSEGGRIFLKASHDTYVDGDGRIVATGTKGGQVEVLGNRVAVMDQTSIDVSGTNGGGTILVGGDYQGKNPDIQNSQITYFGPGATLRANSTGHGDGGKVIVWADDTTRAYGHIEARGESNGGDGGFVETSGKRYLDYRGFTDTRAAQGKAGMLLLDPTDISIVAGSGVTGGTLSGTFTPASSTATIGWNDIITQLGTTPVTINTSSAYGGNGDITFAAGASYTSVNDLSFTASRYIYGNGVSITNNGTGNISLTANNNIYGNGMTLSTGGSINLTSNVGSTSSSVPAISVNIGGNPFMLNATVSTAANGGIEIQTTNTPTEISLSDYTANGWVKFSTGGSWTYNSGLHNFYSTSRVHISAAGGVFIDENFSSDGQIIIDARGSTFTLGESGSITSDAAGNAILLSGASFINDSDIAVPLDTTGGGRWQVWTTTPATLQQTGASVLAENFRQYNSTLSGYLGGAPILGTGNGFLFSTNPVVSLALSGATSKAYDGTTASSGSGLNVSGTSVYGDVVPSFSSSFAFETKDAGTNKNVIAYAGTAVNATYGSIPVYGLSGGGQSVAASVGTITPAMLSVVTGITANDKVYDATTSATLNYESASFTGKVAGDSLTVASATGMFADKNVGSNKTVAISGITLGGADAGNYTLLPYAIASTTASITPAPISLNVDGIVVSNKVYDATTTATFSGTATATVTPLGADKISLNGSATSASFADKNAGTGKTVNIHGYTLSGADAGNYQLVPTTNLTADITPLPVTYWSGGSGSWSSAANWVGGIVPETGNVLAASIPAGATVTYDASYTGLNKIESQGHLMMPGGVLDISGNFSSARFSQTGGTLKAHDFLVSEAFSQTAGSIQLTGVATITQTSGELMLGGLLSANSIRLSAPVIRNDGEVQSAGTAHFVAGSYQSQGGTLIAQEDTADIVGQIGTELKLNDGASLQAGHDVRLTFTSAVSMLYLNESGERGWSPSFILAKSPHTIYLNFTSLASGGVVIDGVPTLATPPWGSGSGFYYTPDYLSASPGSGLSINYGGTNFTVINSVTNTINEASEEDPTIYDELPELKPYTAVGYTMPDETIGGGSNEFGQGQIPVGDGKNEWLSYPQGEKRYAQCRG